MTAFTPTVTCNPDGIPVELRALRQFIVWTLEPPTKEGDKPKKMPRNPKNGEPAKSNDPATWGTYEEACRKFASGGYAGIGFEFDPNAANGLELTGFDIDGCRDPQTGAINDEAQSILDSLHTYAEISQSGTGIKGLVFARKPAGACKRGNVEMYDSVRFFALTGNRVEGMPATVEDRQAEIDALHRMWFPQREKPAASAEARRPIVVEKADAELLEIARHARNGAVFGRLWDGNTEGYPGHSEADLALCRLLAFYCGGDETRIDALFRQSGLIRDKWDQRRRDLTYGQITIRKAAEGMTEFYECGREHAFCLPEAAPPALLPERKLGPRLQLVKPASPIETDPLPEQASSQEDEEADNEEEAEPISLAAPAPTTPDAWKRRGKQLYNWKQATDDAYKIAMGEWWAVEVVGFLPGEKEKFGLKMLGLKPGMDARLRDAIQGQFRQIQNWASVYRAWQKSSVNPQSLPYYMRETLMAQDEETKQKYVDLWHHSDPEQRKRPKRTALRAELNIKDEPKKREPKSWRYVTSPLSVSLGDELADIMKSDGGEEIARQFEELGRKLVSDHKLRKQEEQAARMLETAYQSTDDSAPKNAGFEKETAHAGVNSQADEIPSPAASKTKAQTPRAEEQTRRSLPLCADNPPAELYICDTRFSITEAAADRQPSEWSYGEDWIPQDPEENENFPTVETPFLCFTSVADPAPVGKQGFDPGDLASIQEAVTAGQGGPEALPPEPDPFASESRDEQPLTPGPAPDPHVPASSDPLARYAGMIEAANIPGAMPTNHIKLPDGCGMENLANYVKVQAKRYRGGDCVPALKELDLSLMAWQTWRQAQVCQAMPNAG